MTRQAVVVPSSAAAAVGAQPQHRTTTTTAASVLPLSMRILKSCGGCGCSCQNCDDDDDDEPNDDNECNGDDDDTPMDLGSFFSSIQSSNYNNNHYDSGGVSSLVRQPMQQQHLTKKNEQQQQQSIIIIERILVEYKVACQFYSVTPNAGILTTLRFQLPCLRTTTIASSSLSFFQDADMLALAEILFRHVNGPLKYIRRLDFSNTAAATTAGRVFLCHDNSYFGFGSHGALALAKVLQMSQHIHQVFLDRNCIGPFGASAIFMAIAKNPTIRAVKMRRCRISERGGMAFASQVLRSSITGLQSIDLSANHIGYRGCIAIERAVASRRKQQRTADDDVHSICLDLEGNLVFQEIMNGVTHGLGVLLALTGSGLLSAAVTDKSRLHYASCAIYSASLVVLYTSSTLYHSFFSMRNAKYVFEVMDKCAIYILIAGSYTPCLQIVLSHEPMWSRYLLAFLWLLCFLGICVEFAWPTWPAKFKFSLAMYLCMGWSAVVCLPELASLLPREAVDLMVLGGVAYTAGVPFFVRDNSTY